MESKSLNVIREYFRSRNLPEISRKLTAYIECRKQKIKCYIRNSLPPYVRYKKRGVGYTVN
jgi:hypothetical protein